ncbi:mechanosensitive ion channel family protein [Arthrobacter jiangjiafuii]|uniref:Mechanosensitive ion channel family protein n=1 Tax=Arthrobacter jiangjiafuii TaxID=2817475 RepID=A0A975M5H7_9MICC|nr:mechanosensitive ion channel domain-containing protein [Arthrobacter jiangjiafuii]MBP3042446.1 mechanosensitive ion channel [Arthrobacter jiangjiafuii]QWC09806.1 mechanosensitive ion channel family protein [Arthrobacter jiangjiafuii]
MEDLLAMASGLKPVFAVLLAVAAALLLARAVRESTAKIFRRVPRIREVITLGRNPLRLVLSLIGVRIALGATASGFDWFKPVSYVLTLALIASLCWLGVVVLLIVEVMLLSKYKTDTKDNRRMRRLKTQVMLGRRVGVAVIITIAVACVLLTIPEVRALGAGILASAGLISIVAGLAVQSTLTNVFAGMQLAFTDAIRVDDVVVVETQWGTIEEITMTYVVVHLWDDRRLILPSTYFTTTPFENWTRKQSAILGTVELDLDWGAPVGDLRAHLKETLAGTELWDGRTGVLQITDAVNSLVRVRILVSAADSGALFDLRCLVREAMVTYLQEWHPGALPRQRWAQVQEDGPKVHSGPRSIPGGDPQDTSTSQFFTGSIEAVDRRHSFAGPGKEVYEEREENSPED